MHESIRPVLVARRHLPLRRRLRIHLAVEVKVGSIAERIHDALTHHTGWHPVSDLGFWLHDVEPNSLTRALVRMVRRGEIEVRTDGDRFLYRAIEAAEDGEPWFEWAHRRLGIVRQPDRFGRRRRPSKAQVFRHVLGYKPDSYIKASETIGNPPLHRLERLARQLSTDLNGAARFSRELARRICEQESA